ncbi:radical SAM family heme chaperone HemW [Algoriphagus antarcticus]|uniref:Heme chaperone HemW n=1 Tax=Algoriphagus antarcticus TaxID=238540 RepID=A0A3E0DZ57_9BACT|nr:radical SAM family heme chaperone HemW [Algoriphagus antarcticus]REG88436.1 oxygen-independent coproporphyrinogen-3 oxidase [Algoriphagus antarcticus]
MDTKKEVFKGLAGIDYIRKIIEFTLAGIYIHIPFCKQACHYCDFHFSTNLERMDQMTEMICHELELRADYLKNKNLETVYFGGGTPSLLKPKLIEKILSQIAKTYNSGWKEVTLEANPDDLSVENLSTWKNLGIDRLSLGIQSFDEDVLKFYNRAHTSEESKSAIAKARKIGFEKFSLDLIYGYPQPDHTLWNQDLSEALAQNPGHISSYALTVEPKTALGNWAKKGAFQPADEDFVAEQFEMLQEQTDKAGYIQYEVSNFGKPDQFALHNTNYWKGVPYLGVGPSAHSFDGKNRGANPSNNSLYLKSMERQTIPFAVDNLTDEERLNEYILTGLRTLWGIDFGVIHKDFDHDLLSSKKSILAQMDSEGWLEWKDKNLSLSKSGKLLADSIAAALFV